MIAILSAGRLPEREKFIVKCWRCDTVFSFRDGDQWRRWPEGLANPPIEYMPCPMCGVEVLTDIEVRV